MAIVGGYIGGGVEMVPAGYGQLCLQWLTPDRKNMDGVTFSIESVNGKYSVSASSDGRGEAIVPVGTYTVSVSHTGIYDGDMPQQVVVESTQSYLVLFGVAKVNGALIIPDYFLGATIEITESVDGTSIYSGPMTPMTLNTGLTTVHIKIIQNSITNEFDLPIVGKTSIPSDKYVSVAWSDELNMFAESVECMGQTVPVEALDHFCVLKNLGTVEVVFHSGDYWQATSEITASASISIAESDVAISIGYTDPGVYAGSGNFQLPYAGRMYYFTLIGGGGGGAGGQYYGGSPGNAGYAGRIVSGSITPTDSLSFSISIGKGGEGGQEGEEGKSPSPGTSGKSTSVSGIISLSAAGGNGGSTGDSNGYGSYGGSGSNGVSASVRGYGIGYGTGGNKNTMLGDTTRSPGGKSNITRFPELSHHFGKTVADGGDGGYSTVSGTAGTDQWRYMYPGYGGKGIKTYGNGGAGGGTSLYWGETERYHADNGRGGTNGAVFVEMKL